MTTNENPAITARAIAFVERGIDLALTNEEITTVLEDSIDIEPTLENTSINRLLRDARSRFTSDDDFDDFRREVYAVLAGDDACDTCGYDVDDCECDDEDDE
jgi:hypothetical protein